MARKRASRTVSDRTLRLLEEIHRSRSARFGSPEAGSLVERAASCREPRAVLYLRELFLDRRRIWVNAASRSIMELLECLGAADMLWFDDLMRHGWLPRAELSLDRWWRLRPLRFTWLLARLDDPRAALLLGLSHTDGFIRAIALRRAARRDMREAMPLVAIRLLDWVPQVRAEASTAWTRLTSSADLGELVALLSLTLRLERRSRRKELDRGMGELRGRLAANDGEGLRLGTMVDEPLVRRHCFEGLLAAGADPDDLAGHALADPDPIVQAWALAEPLAALQLSARSRRLKEASRAGRARVRGRALQLMCDMDAPEARALLEEALLDPASTVREFAIWALEKASALDVTEFYRRRVDTQSGRALAAAITELGRRGGPSDVERITDILTRGPTPRVHTACLRALGRLAPDAARPHLVVGIQSPSNRVARTARDLLLRDRGTRCRDLSELARSAEPGHSRLYALSVVRRRCPKWFRLIVMLEVVLEGSEPTAAAAGSAITEWLATFNRSAVPPTPDEVRRLGWLIDRCESHFPPKTLRDLRFVLSSHETP